MQDSLSLELVQNGTSGVIDRILDVFVCHFRECHSLIHHSSKVS